jgi:hypothetical protein
MNEAIRPEGYTANERTLEKAKKKLAKDLAWKQWSLAEFQQPLYPPIASKRGPLLTSSSPSLVYAHWQCIPQYANQVSFAATYQSKDKLRDEAVQISKHVLSVVRRDEPSLHWVSSY